MSNFRRKTTKLKADTQYDAEIAELENTISIIHSQGIPVPQDLIERLSKLKALKSPNKINARKIIYNGIEYDSVREAKIAKRFDEAGIRCQYQVEIELQEGFKLANESIRPVNLVIDFIVEDEWLVDCKGHLFDVFKIKWKMLKKKFLDTKKYVILSNDKEITDFINLVKKDRWTLDL
jgi:hypothetical protein